MSLTVGSAPLGWGVLLLVDAHDLDGGVGGGREHVPVVEEGVLVVADVDEGGLEAGVEVLDPALVDAADHAVVGLALDLELLEAAVDEQRDALLERLGVDDELAEGALFLLEDREDLLEDRALFGALERRRLSVRRDLRGRGWAGGGLASSSSYLGDVLGGRRDVGWDGLIAHGGVVVGWL
jgi:hypothetical protein